MGAKRCQMIGDGFAQLAVSRSRSNNDRLKIGDEILHAQLAYRAERALLRWKVVVETGLPHAESLGDVPGAGSGISLFRKYRCRRVEHFAITALPTRCRFPSGSGWR